MTRTRTMALAIAVVCGTCAILAAFWLHSGLLRGGDVLADVVRTSWSRDQIKAFMQHAGPVSLLLVALGLAMMFWSTLRAKKQ